MNNNKKVFVVGGSNDYANWMPFEYELVNNIEQADVVIFTGGEDVSPHLYGEKKHFSTYTNLNRDLREVEAYKIALKLGKKMIGICRGCQFLSVMNGTKLVQDQENKYPFHPITLDTGEEIIISSTHHQSVYPYNLDESKYKLIGYTKGLSKYHSGANDDLNPEFEVEIIGFPETQCLGIQGHPEFTSYQRNYSDDFKRVQKIVSDFFGL